MRVGVYMGELPPNPGGGGTVQDDLCMAIDQGDLEHDFVFLCHHRSQQVAGISKGIVYLEDFAETRSPSDDKQGLLTRIFGKRPSVSPSYTPTPAWSGYNSDLIDQAVSTYDLDLIWFVSPAELRTTAPYFYTVWDLAHRTLPWFPEVSTSGWLWEAREKHYQDVLPRAAKVIVGSDTGREEVASYFAIPPANIATIPFFPPAYCREERQVSDSSLLKDYDISGPYLFYPAQFWPHKNHCNLLYALDLMRRQGVSIELVLTGADKGNEQYVRSVVERLGLDEQVHFLGFVPQEHIRLFYEHAVALGFASFMGPDNIPPLEAMALGCPVVSSCYPGAKQQLGDAAIFFDPANPQEIAASLMRVISDSDLRTDLIMRGKQLVANSDASAYIGSVCRLVDEFEPIVRCWGHGYTHP